MRLVHRLLASLACLVLLGPTAYAEPDAPPTPPLLTPWIPWVLDGLGEQRCPELDGVHVCVWPSSLELDMVGSSASFTLQVTSVREGPVPLPGSAARWPRDVRVDGKETPVLEPRGMPEVTVSSGTHTITGRFVFLQKPSALEIPANTGAFSLRIDGQRVTHPKREASGLVWIAKSEAGEESVDRLTLSVHRRIVDAVPLRITTRIEITASGTPRETVLEGVLLPNTRPISLTANLPVQLAENGQLRVQPEAGSYRVEVVAIAETPPAVLRAQQFAPPWPDHELWVFKADDQLRHVELSGPPQIDSARSDLADDWRGLPTFMMKPASALQFEVRRRGQTEPAPNRLRLERTLWLDLDGDGYTIRDHIQGTMQQGFRLDLLAGVLGHAVVAGRDELVTRYENRSGIELRQRELDIATEWRLEHGQRELPAVGYSADADVLSATLNLPPGFELLGASGVDVVRGTWLDRWDLFAFFFVLLTSLAVAKVAGRAYGVGALAALILTQHEFAAPAATWVALVIATALTRVLVRGRWARVAQLSWLLSLIALLLVLVPFSVERIRAALYPQLDESGLDGVATPEQLSLTVMHHDEEGSMALPPPATPPPTPEAKEAAEQLLQGAQSGGGAALGDTLGYDASPMLRDGAMRGIGPKSGAAPSRSDRYAARDLIDPSAIVQTGPGVPNWRFASFSLQWSGPVQRDERLQLWIMPPIGTRACALASVLLSGLLLLALVRAARLTRIVESESPPPPIAPAAAIVLLLGSLATAPGAAQSPVQPSSDLLDELRRRLLEQPACTPDCVSVAELTLALSDQTLSLRAELHAEAGAIYRAPGPLSEWPIDRIRIDGKDALAAARLSDDFVRVRIPAGIHKLELSGPIPTRRAFTLSLGTPAPHRVNIEGKGWRAEGLHADGTAEDSLELRREVSQLRRGESGEQALTQWLAVERELELGLRFRVRTTLSRLGSGSDSVLVRIPLLPGESVNEAGLTTEAGSVIASLPRDQQTLSFVSTLAPRERIELVAAQPSTAGVLESAYSEAWRIVPSALYRVRFEGIAPVTLLDEQGTFAPVYRPWPGEKLIVHAARLQAAQGASVTIDKAELRYTPGARMELSKLTLSIRASRGTTERITLPDDATLASLEVDHKPHPARLKRGLLELPLDPGSHEIAVTLQRPTGISFRYTPKVPAVSRPLTNVLSSVELPGDRWLLAVDGPSWGPAILLWGYLLMIVLTAVALGYVPHSPLRAHQWALLSLGLTQVDTWIALLVVGWLFALAYREETVISGRRLFNLVQVMLVLFSVVALWGLAYAVHQGLLAPPDMQVQGMMSNHSFVQWYADRAPGTLPEITVWSAPLWIYKGLMLLWALWLAASLINWLRWGWAAFRKGGGYRSKPKGPPPRGGLRAQPAATALESTESTDRERARTT